jgi:hypothetical protein
MFSARRTRMSSKGFWSTRIARKVPSVASQRDHFSCGAFFFSSSTALQRTCSMMSSLPVRSAA